MASIFFLVRFGLHVLRKTWKLFSRLYMNLWHTLDTMWALIGQKSIVYLLYTHKIPSCETTPHEANSQILNLSTVFALEEKKRTFWKSKNNEIYLFIYLCQLNWTCIVLKTLSKSYISFLCITKPSSMNTSCLLKKMSYESDLWL